MRPPATPPSTDLDLTFRLSFRPFVQYLTEQRQFCPATDQLSALYSYLIEQFSVDAETELVPDPDRLSTLFQLATVAVLPLTHINRGLSYAFGLPFPWTVFHYSERFGQLLNQYPTLTANLAAQISPQEQQRFLYRLILEKHYGQPSQPETPSFHFQEPLRELTKYYAVSVDTTFLAARPNRSLPPLNPAWIAFAHGEGPAPDPNHALPIQEFAFEGFAFFMLEDVTEAETLLQLREIFAHLHSEAEPVLYRRFETALRNLCGQPDLEISIVPFQQVNGNFVHQSETSARSVILRHSEKVIDGYKDPVAQQLLRELIQEPVPRLFPNLEGLPETERERLRQYGFRSFLWYPIVADTEGLGILEMASPQPDAFAEGVLPKIEQVIPLVQELLRYQLHQFNQQLAQLIKDKFTSLQPAVEWKFREAAWEYLRLGRNEPLNSPATQVRFPQVFPLYGAVDIRNSSQERYKAVRQDFSDQFTALQTLLRELDFPEESARLRQLSARASFWQETLTADPNPEDELGMAEFLTQEINPYLQQIQRRFSEPIAPLTAYFRQTTAADGQFHAALQRYERSVEWLNTVVNSFIEEAEKQLQALYPHYFERYRTDGMEYTIYVGPSIAPQKPFEPGYLRQFYQWQLNTMVEMAHLTHLIRPNLPVRLQTTQLLLAHTHPVDISFRQDEHRFDVEGSYSIRYEVLKKRIDKALVAGTQERLTQPDTLVLVYTNAREIADYLPFIAQFQQQKKVRPSLEYLNLEPLQGVAHLKALRLHLNYPAD
ncbi:GAF domain-containing protein [Larkinella bovis]|uniref:GAF domain-containing protein n=1 Tax=Larkinella bovis TaxID=683041 RepID=A0ABW0IA05_9BACT